MGNNKRLIFEMNIIHERLLEIEKEYNSNLTARNEPITDISVNRNEGRIRVRFETFAYLIFVFKGAYIITWFHREKDKFISDGVTTCKDVADVMREMYDRIFSGISPRHRSSYWYQYGLPKKEKKKGGA